MAKQPLTSFCPSSPNKIFHGGCTIGVCAKYSTESAGGRNQVCLPWTPLPAPNFPGAFLFPSHPSALPVLPQEAHSDLGEVENWALSVLTASQPEPGSTLTVILDVSGCAEGKVSFLCCLFVGTRRLPGSERAGDAPAVLFLLMKINFQSFADKSGTACELRQWKWATVRFYVDIHVFILKMCILM